MPKTIDKLLLFWDVWDNPKWPVLKGHPWCLGWGGPSGRYTSPPGLSSSLCHWKVKHEREHAVLEEEKMGRFVSDFDCLSNAQCWKMASNYCHRWFHTSLHPDSLELTVSRNWTLLRLSMSRNKILLESAESKFWIFKFPFLNGFNWKHGTLIFTWHR